LRICPTSGSVRFVVLAKTSLSHNQQAIEVSMTAIAAARSEAQVKQLLTAANVTLESRLYPFQY
jgi:hypothetical protein